MAVGARGVEVGEAVGDGVPSSSEGGVGDRVTVGVFVAAAVLVGELISVVASVLVGGLAAAGVRVEVAVGVGVPVGPAGLVAVGKGG